MGHEWPMKSEFIGHSCKQREALPGDKDADGVRRRVGNQPAGEAIVRWGLLTSSQWTRENRIRLGFLTSSSAPREVIRQSMTSHKQLVRAAAATLPRCQASSLAPEGRESASKTSLVSMRASTHNAQSLSSDERLFYALEGFECNAVLQRSKCKRGV